VFATLDGSNMVLLIACFVLFFGIAELYPLSQGISLPMPVFMVAGFLLAIASNYHKPAGLPWRSKQSLTAQSSSGDDPPTATATTKAPSPTPPATASQTMASTSRQSSSNPLPPRLKKPGKSPELPHLPQFDTPMRQRSENTFTVRQRDR
jgi:hypothetical protein